MRLIAKFAVAALAVPAILVTNAFAQAVPAKIVEAQWFGQATIKITSPGGKVDAIRVTRAHFDHWADAPALAAKNNAKIYGPAGRGRSATTLDIVPAGTMPGFNKSGTLMSAGPGIKVFAVRAEHSSDLNWKNPATGKDEMHVGGEPLGFIVELENGLRIYHMGDTGLFGDMMMIGEYYKPDLILIPIGGNSAMDPKDAAYTTRAYLKPTFSIPIHYGTLPVLNGTRGEYTEALGKTSPKSFVINPGVKQESWPCRPGEALPSQTVSRYRCHHGDEI